MAGLPLLKPRLQEPGLEEAPNTNGRTQLVFNWGGGHRSPQNSLKRNGCTCQEGILTEPLCAQTLGPIQQEALLLKTSPITATILFFSLEKENEQKFQNWPGEAKEAIEFEGESEGEGPCTTSPAHL